MQLRYSFRLYLTPGQQSTLARSFGCARVVFNDAIAARRGAYEATEKAPTASELSKKLVTDAKSIPGRVWLAEVSAVVLQQALRDADRAYIRGGERREDGRTGRESLWSACKTRTCSGCAVKQEPTEATSRARKPAPPGAVGTTGLHGR